MQFCNSFWEKHRKNTIQLKFLGPAEPVLQTKVNSNWILKRSSVCGYRKLVFIFWGAHDKSIDSPPNEIKCFAAPKPKSANVSNVVSAVWAASVCTFCRSDFHLAGSKWHEMQTGGQIHKIVSIEIWNSHCCHRRLNHNLLHTWFHFYFPLKAHKNQTQIPVRQPTDQQK